MQIKSIIMLVSLILGGCSLYKKPDAPMMKTPEHFQQVKLTYKQPIAKDWWRQFKDPQLNHLVSVAVANNYSYQVAVKNIEIARTYINQYQSSRWPQVNLYGNFSRNQDMNIFNNPTNFNGSNGTNSGLPNSHGIYNLAQLFASVSYELDVWNQIGNQVNQAVADTAASAANSQVVKLSLLNSVIDTYYQLASLNANITNYSQQRHMAEKIVSLTRTQFRSGLIDQSAVETAKNQLEQINDTLSLLQKQKQVTQFTLAYLLGQFPENFKVSLPRALPALNYARLIPPALPSQMMLERPDIQQAYQQVMSTGYVEKQAYANFFPTLALTGSYGYGSQTLSNLINHYNSFWNYGLNIVQPVFDYQLRSSEYKRAQLQAQNAVLNYRGVVLNAFKEVNSALASYQKDSEALTALKRTYKNNLVSYSLVKAQYRGGLVDYTAVLTSHLALLQSGYLVNNQKILVIQDILQVYKALGVGIC